MDATYKRLDEMVRGLELERWEKLLGVPQGPPSPPITAQQMLADIEWITRPPVAMVFTFYGEAANLMPKGTMIIQKELPTWMQEMYRKQDKKITMHVYVRDDDEAGVLEGFREKGILYELSPNVMRDKEKQA